MQAIQSHTSEALKDEYDYIVVGSGAGGGPVAVNLAKHGFSVLLLEAGGADEPIEYQVPAFHGLSCEHPDLAWKFYVKHYSSSARQKSDRLNFVDEEVDGLPRRGIYYPRAGTLGGCTAHNALICIYPHNSDWEHIAAVTGDASWAPSRMRRYFERLERCQYANEPASKLLNCARHGFNGWLPTSLADPTLLLRDGVLARLVIAAAQACRDANIWKLSRPWHGICGWLAGFLRPRQWGENLPRQLEFWLQSFLDPNDWGRVKQSLEGPVLTPLTIGKGLRRGTRELIQEAMMVCPDRLTVRLAALVQRVTLDDDNRATGVEFLDAPHLYRADPALAPDGAMTAPLSSVREKHLRFVRVKREVILAGGAFNTPQLLMLSGIGPCDELKSHGIKVNADLPGVGRNLQDRYEVGIVHKMDRNFDLLRGATFTANDSHFKEWRNGYGLYSTNGAVIAIIKKSCEGHLEPDLYLFAVPNQFSGYRPLFSKCVEHRNYFTWVILKAHTNNTAGRVTLCSSDPRDVPDINFHYFEEGNDPYSDDLDSVVAGIEFVRRITARTASLFVEEIPGPQVRSRADLGRFVRNSAWGHHACGTCKIGNDNDKCAVLDSQFRVRKTKGLRVVDASVFPRIPGFFILSAIYMIAEKASDAILEDAKR